MTDNLEQPSALAEPVTEVNWTFRIVVAVLIVATLAVGVMLGVTVVPRWWAQRIGDRVDGRMTEGVLYGTMLGFVFTLLPLVVLRQVFRPMKRWLRISVLVVALLLAAPNLLTLAIVVGNGSGAHAGDRILDVDAPGFRLGTTIGAISGALLALTWLIASWNAKRSRKKVDRLRAENKAAQQALRDAAEGDTPQ